MGKRKCAWCNEREAIGSNSFSRFCSKKCISEWKTHNDSIRNTKLDSRTRTNTLMISCPSCKSKIDSGAKTCPNCGACGSEFETKLQKRAEERERISREEVKRLLGKDGKPVIINCKSCSKKVKKSSYSPTKNSSQFCDVNCSRDYLNNQFLGLSLLFRKKPSFTWTEMSVKNKIVSILQILLIIILLLTGTFI